MLISLTLLTTVLLHQNHLSSGSHLLPVDGNLHYWPFLRHHVHYAQQVYPVLVDGAPHEVRHSANINEDALVSNAKHELETVARLLGLQSGARNMFASFRPSSFFSRTVSSSLSTMTTTSTSTVYCASGTHFVTSSPPFCPASVKRDVRAVESEFSVGQVAPSVTFLVNPTELPTSSAGIVDSTLIGDEDKFDVAVESSIDSSPDSSDLPRNSRQLLGRFMFSPDANTATIMAVVATSTTVTAAVNLGDNMACIPPGFVICQS